MTAAVSRHDRRVSPVFLLLVVVCGLAGWVVWEDATTGTGFAVFVFVVAGWVVSLCLHEYAHARTALHSGDVSIGAKGYLTLNPLKYAHPLLSIGLPVLFVVLGGIGLPGGAVFIERHRIRGRWRHSLIAAAGPATNVLFAVVVSAPFWLGLLDDAPPAFQGALAFLALLQVSAALLNLLPVPGLDGYAVIEPWLSPGARQQVAPFAPFGLLLVIGLLWIPEVGGAFFDAVDALLRTLDVPESATRYGYDVFRFWRDVPPAETGWYPAQGS